MIRMKFKCFYGPSNVLYATCVFDRTKNKNNKQNTSHKINVIITLREIVFLITYDDDDVCVCVYFDYCSIDDVNVVLSSVSV